MAEPPLNGVAETEYTKMLLCPNGETIALFTDEKRGKSHQRKASRPPLRTTSHPVESAAESNARQVCAIYNKIKKLLSISFAHHHPYRACEHSMPQKASRFDGVDGSRHGF